MARKLIVFTDLTKDQRLVPNVQILQQRKPMPLASDIDTQVHIPRHMI